MTVPGTNGPNTIHYRVFYCSVLGFHLLRHKSTNQPQAVEREVSWWRSLQLSGDHWWEILREANVNDSYRNKSAMGKMEAASG